MDYVITKKDFDILKDKILEYGFAQFLVGAHAGHSDIDSVYDDFANKRDDLFDYFYKLYYKVGNKND